MIVGILVFAPAAILIAVMVAGVIVNGWGMGPSSAGIALHSSAHPTAPWYRRAWTWIFHRDIRKSALETVEIELKPSKRKLGDFT